MIPATRSILTPDGVSISYRDYRPDGPVRATSMLVHGLASSGLQFDRDAQYLQQHGYRVLVPDLRGHGQSGIPDGPIDPADFTIAMLAADLLAVLDHAEVSAVHWVGNSLGGILALFLLGTPQVDRLHSLTLFGTCFALQLPSRSAHCCQWPFCPAGR